MALNRSPEFKSSNPKPSAAELFCNLRPPSEQTRKNYAILFTKFQASESLGSETEDFFMLLKYFYASNPGAPGVRPFWTLGPWFEQTW